MKALVLLSLLGVVSLLSEIFNFKKLMYPIVLVGLAVTFFVNVGDWNTNEIYFNMMRHDNYAVAFSSVMIAVAFLWFLMSHSFFEEKQNMTDHFALVLFALAGTVIMVSYTNMTMLFLGIEILSISMYVLAGSRKDDLGSNEAAFKYLIMGAFATGFLLFGITLIYGSTGSFDLSEIKVFIAMHPDTLPGIFYVGILLMLIGLAFKISAAPFHFWAPDVYEGAPTVITAFMATIVKTAAFAAFLRLFTTAFSEVSETYVDIVWVMAAVTLLLGNMSAVLQTNTKRLLAYSSIAHAGYMLLALLADNEFSNSSILFYTAAYSIGSIVTFCILLIVSKAKNDGSISAFNGLAKSNPLLAVTMSLALLSLAGIPPTAGFFAKYFIFTAAFKSGYIILVLIAVSASLIGVYYYFKIVINMYFKSSNDAPAIIVETKHKVLLFITAMGIVILGLFPDLIISLLL